MTRLNLHEKLCEFIGNRNVYFEPPSEMKLKYPGIVYHVDDKVTKTANNRNYIINTVYNVTVITTDPDDANAMADRFLDEFETSKCLGQGKADGLYNITFKITTTRRNSQ